MAGSNAGHVFSAVIPAKAGIQSPAPQRRGRDSWIPAFAGMTVET